MTGASDPVPRSPRIAPDLVAAPGDLRDDEVWEGQQVGGSFAGITATHVDIVGCRLSRAMFTGADIDRLRLADTVLDDCDLSGAALSRLSATRVVFRRCRLSGVVVSGARFTDARFDECKFDGANLRMTTWQRTLFDSCLMTDSDFREAKLATTRFERCDLTRIDFTKAVLPGVHLGGSTLTDIRGGDALRGVVITSDQVVSLAMAIFSSLGIRIDDD